MKEKMISDCVLCILNEVYIDIKHYYKLNSQIKNILFDQYIEKPNFKNSININGRLWLSYEYAKRYFLYDFPSKDFFLKDFYNQSSNRKIRDKLALAFQNLLYFQDSLILNEITDYCKSNKVPIIEGIYSTFRLFKFLSISKLNLKSKFFIYYYALNQESFENLIFITNSYSSFENKYYKYIKDDLKAFFHGNLNNNYALKIFDKEDEDLVEDLYKDGTRLSLRQILFKLNSERLYRGKSKVSITKLKDYLKNGNNLLKLDLQRNGSSSIEKMILHGQRIQPQNPGSVYQIDGTRLNIIATDSNHKPVFYTIIVVLDVFSKKILDFKLIKIENFISHKNLLNNVFKETGFIPSEILMDNLSSFRSKDAENYFNSLTTIGCRIRKHSALTPQDKGHIENWFHLFGNLYLKDVPGYLGDGIKSKLKNGKPNEDLIKLYKYKSNFRTCEELNSLIKDKIKEYNNSYIYKNSTPQNLFINTDFKGIELNEDLNIFLFYQSKVITLNKAYITIQSNHKILEYPIYKDNIKFLEENYNKAIRVYFNSESIDYVFVTSIITNILTYNCIKLNLHTPLPLANADQTKDDKKNWNKLRGKRKSLKIAFKNLVTEEGQKSKTRNKRIVNKIEILPVELIDEKFDSKELVNNSNNSDLISKNPNTILSLNDLYKVSGDNKLIN